MTKFAKLILTLALLPTTIGHSDEVCPQELVVIVAGQYIYCGEICGYIDCPIGEASSDRLHTIDGHCPDCGTPLCSDPIGSSSSAQSATSPKRSLPKATEGQQLAPFVQHPGAGIKRYLRCRGTPTNPMPGNSEAREGNVHRPGRHVEILTDKQLRVRIASGVHCFRVFKIQIKTAAVTHTMYYGQEVSENDPLFRKQQTENATLQPGPAGKLHVLEHDGVKYRVESLFPIDP